jgi:hypothetical protein
MASARGTLSPAAPNRCSPYQLGSPHPPQLRQAAGDRRRLLGRHLGEHQLEPVALQVPHPQLVAVPAGRQHLQALDGRGLRLRQFRRRPQHAHVLPGGGVAILQAGVADVPGAHPQRLRQPPLRLVRGQAPLLDPQVGVLALAARLVGGDLLDHEGLG